MQPKTVLCSWCQYEENRGKSRHTKCKGRQGCQCLCRYDFQEPTPEQKQVLDRKQSEIDLKKECPICHMSRKFHSSADVIRCKSRAKQQGISF